MGGDHHWAILGSGCHKHVSSWMVSPPWWKDPSRLRMKGLLTSVLFSSHAPHPSPPFVHHLPKPLTFWIVTQPAAILLELISDFLSHFCTAGPGPGSPGPMGSCCQSPGSVMSVWEGLCWGMVADVVLPSPPKLEASGRSTCHRPGHRPSQKLQLCIHLLSILWSENWSSKSLSDVNVDSQ